MKVVRINKFKETHMNAYARVTSLDEVNGTVTVSNMNMPFQGTFGGEVFKITDVTFIEDGKKVSGINSR